MRRVARRSRARAMPQRNQVPKLSGVVSWVVPWPLDALKARNAYPGGPVPSCSRWRGAPGCPAPARPPAGQKGRARMPSSQSRHASMAEIFRVGNLAAAPVGTPGLLTQGRARSHQRSGAGRASQHAGFGKEMVGRNHGLNHRPLPVTAATGSLTGRRTDLPKAAARVDGFVAWHFNLGPERSSCMGRRLRGTSCAAPPSTSALSPILVLNPTFARIPVPPRRPATRGGRLAGPAARLAAHPSRDGSRCWSSPIFCSLRLDPGAAAGDPATLSRRRPCGSPEFRGMIRAQAPGRHPRSPRPPDKPAAWPSIPGTPPPPSRR